MSLCRPIKTGISTASVVCNCITEDAFNASVALCITRGHTQCNSASASASARIGSLAPPNWWIHGATHGQKFLPPPPPESFDTCSFFSNWKSEESNCCTPPRCEEFLHTLQLFLVAAAAFVYAKLWWISSLQTINWSEGRVWTDKLLWLDLIIKWAKPL